MSNFRGFPPELFTFFAGLERDNSKTYWEANKTIWETKVNQPIGQLMADLEVEFPRLRMFRPNRDIRFSKDKSPYKLWAGITSTSRAAGGIGYFMQVQASGLEIACGTMLMERDQLERFRTALDHDTHGPQFEKLSKQLAAKSLPVTSGYVPTLKRIPPGYPTDHPRAEFLHWKGAVVIKEYEKAEWMYTPGAFDKIYEVWHGAEALMDWIDTHVEASQEPSKRAR